MRHHHPPKSLSMNDKARRPRLNSPSLILPTRILRRRNLAVITREELRQMMKAPYRRIRIGRRKQMLLPRGIMGMERRGLE